ncbi:hypothetical protein BDB00DRAFT_870165 [Zychaea mexicana]|uniref:uncharacterized protein n=1 Tax=Zychaea mexicana TaxID=64656 RepID=UPI0022FE83A7|nr:uncharacterized protein BDB00DRAFT_870165 [Zychaea mexicana]KAI9495614.1 hypothetical protein BDB00DRAFT_870165 [Zychaea mexicana]
MTDSATSNSNKNSSNFISSIHAPTTSKTITSNYQQQQQQQQQKLLLHAPDKEFMMLVDEYTTEDLKRRRAAAVARQRSSSSPSRHYENMERNRTVPLDIPTSSPSNAQVTPQPAPVLLLLPATCPVNSSTRIKLPPRSNDFTVGSMPIEESPIPWPTQMLDHVRTPDSSSSSMVHLSEYIQTPFANDDLVDEQLLFKMDD